MGADANANLAAEFARTPMRHLSEPERTAKPIKAVESLRLVVIVVVVVVSFAGNLTGGKIRAWLCCFNNAQFDASRGRISGRSPRAKFAFEAAPAKLKNSLNSASRSGAK